MSRELEEFIDGYINDIDKDISVRKMELASLSILLSDEKIDSDKRFYILRTSIPLLYSHYEGFLKYIFDRTIRLFKDLELNITDMKKSFLILGFLSCVDENIIHQYAKTYKLLDLMDIIYIKENKYFDSINLEKIKVKHEDIDYLFRLFSVDDRIVIETMNRNKSLLPLYNKGRKNENVQIDNVELVRLKECISKSLEILYKRRNCIAHGDNTNRELIAQFHILNSTNNGAFKSGLEFFNKNMEVVISWISLMKEIIYSYVIAEEFKELI